MGPAVAAAAAVMVVVSGMWIGEQSELDVGLRAQTFPLGREAGCADIGMSGNAEWDKIGAAEYDRATSATRDLGMGRVRIGASWKEVETHAGQDDWSALDARVASARQAGLDPLLLIQDVPDWVSVPQTTAITQEVIEVARQYGEFAGRVAARYGSAVSDYEIWNEPNLDRFWPTPNPAQYSMFLKAAYPRIHTADPGATVISAGLAPAADTATTLSPMTYLTGMYALGLRDHADAIGMHPYSFPELPSGQSGWNSFRSLSEIHDLMARYGDGDKKIWLTEYGAPTAGLGGKPVSWQMQAESVVEAYALARDTEYLGPIFIYTLVDGGGSSWSTEYHFGLYTDRWVAKPAAGALREALSHCASTGSGSGAGDPGTQPESPAPSGGLGSLGSLGG